MSSTADFGWFGDRAVAASQAAAARLHAAQPNSCGDFCRRSGSAAVRRQSLLDPSARLGLGINSAGPLVPRPLSSGLRLAECWTALNARLGQGAAVSSTAAPLNRRPTVAVVCISSAPKAFGAVPCTRASNHRQRNSSAGRHGGATLLSPTQAGRAPKSIRGRQSRILQHNLNNHIAGVAAAVDHLFEQIVEAAFQPLFFY